MQTSLIEDNPRAPSATLTGPEGALTAADHNGAVEPNRDPASKEEKLQAYTRFKLALAAQVRVLHEALRPRRNERGMKRCDELMTKLAEDRFTLAVLGQFKRGKSSLMNAVIGRELLPVGVLPLTSAITILRFSPKERLLIQHAHWTFQHESYGMKTEALRRQLENTDENDARWRALTHLVGSRRGASAISCDGEI